MKAILYTKYGSPDVLQLQEVAKPTPNDDQILIKIQGASANPLDWHRMRGAPFLVRTEEGWRKPKNPKIGSDMAGRVEAIGKDVTWLKVGDEVYGCIGAGGFAEYAVVQGKKLAPKPTNLSFEETATVPTAALTALQGLRDKGQIQPGQKVLINGAAGGVGTFAVQIAKYYGAEVTGVCSTRNVEMVRSIGADHVIDYTQEDFTKNGQHYDVIYDLVSNHSVLGYRRALSPNGRCIMAGFSSMLHVFQVLIVGSIVSKLGSKQVGMMGVAKPNREDLTFLKELIEAGKIKPVIDRRYPLNETAEAIRYLETGHARGKVIITMPNGG